MIEGVDDVRVDAKENEGYFPILNDHIRVHLQHHVCGALRELHVRMLHLPKHHGLGDGQQEGHDPGTKHHQSEENYIITYMNLMNYLALCLT